MLDPCGCRIQMQRDLIGLDLDLWWMTLWGDAALTSGLHLGNAAAYSEFQGCLKVT